MFTDTAKGISYGLKLVDFLPNLWLESAKKVSKVNGLLFFNKRLHHLKCIRTIINFDLSYLLFLLF